MHRRAVSRTFAAPLLMGLALMSACATSTRWEDLRGPEGAAVGAHAAAVRFVHGTYVSPDGTPPVEGWCLWVPVVSQVAVRDDDGPGMSDHTVSPRLMGRLADLDPPVRSRRQCYSDDDRRLRLLDGGGFAASMSLGMAEWKGADEVMIPLNVREAGNVGLRLECRVVKTLEAWEVAECLQEGP